MKRNYTELRLNWYKITPSSCVERSQLRFLGDDGCTNARVRHTHVVLQVWVTFGTLRWPKSAPTSRYASTCTRAGSPSSCVQKGLAPHGSVSGRSCLAHQTQAAQPSPASEPPIPRLKSGIQSIPPTCPPSPRALPRMCVLQPSTKITAVGRRCVTYHLRASITSLRGCAVHAGRALCERRTQPALHGCITIPGPQLHIGMKRPPLLIALTVSPGTKLQPPT